MSNQSKNNPPPVITSIHREAMNASSKRRNPIIGSTSSELSPAAEVIAYDVDLLTEILVRVPAKTLIRFKSVSKHWLSLITDFHFATKHSRQNPRPSNSALFLYWYEKPGNPKSVLLQGDPTRLTLDFLNGFGFVKIIQSCNGLLLCTYLPSLCPPYQHLVCNPTTQTYSLIPEPPAFSSMHIRPIFRVLLAFDPLKSPCYKVVFIIDLYSHVQIDIYCSETASWKQILAPCRGFRHEAFFGGVIHWLSDDSVAFGFDVESENMREMPKLPGLHYMSGIKYFGEFGGHLILIQAFTPSELIIFELDNDSSIWILKFKVNLGDLFLSMEDRKISYYSVLYIVKGEKEKDFVLVLATPRKVIFYNQSSMTSDVLRDTAPRESSSCGHPYAPAYPFIESLSPL